MKFCPKCGSLLVPRNARISCSCGYSQDEKITIKIEHEQEHTIIDVKETDGLESLPRTEEECPKCGNDKAYFGTQQTGPSDEPEIIIYKCTKCKHTWRSTNHPY
ncbi:MAG: transcription factor S [Candidatus Woesearchaeota archaeon]